MIPRVTVVTPTLNAARYFHDCLASLEAQRESVTVEHIVVDDGSTDDTRDMAVAAGATIFDGERAGLYAAMNLGLAHASGDYVGVLNADDYLYPDALTSLVAAIHRSGRPWAIGSLRWVDGQRRSGGRADGAGCYPLLLGEFFGMAFQPPTTPCTEDRSTACLE